MDEKVLSSKYNSAINVLENFKTILYMDPCKNKSHDNPAMAADNLKLMFLVNLPMHAHKMAINVMAGGRDTAEISSKDGAKVAFFQCSLFPFLFQSMHPDKPSCIFEATVIM